MPIDSKVVRLMLRRIGEFFRYMSDNKEQRLYYVLPINQKFPYAYQHSSIRDVATICDILDLVQFFREQDMEFNPDTLILFENVTGNTLHPYHNLYQKEELPDLPEGNIGDLGFFLLALQKCHEVFPSQLPKNWEKTKNRITKRMIERQTANGSLDIFFDSRLKPYEKSAESFYLPEALIGLIAVFGGSPSEMNDQVESTVQRAIAYLSQEANSDQHMVSDSSTFYANWQFQLLYHWIQKKPKQDRATLSLEATHLEKVINALRGTRIAKKQFGNDVATVEVACYLEGLVHAQHALKMLNRASSAYNSWFEREIDRCITFLYELQRGVLNSFHGGFVHSLHSSEARVDVAGHVFGGLQFLLNINP